MTTRSACAASSASSIPSGCLPRAQVGQARDQPVEIAPSGRIHGDLAERGDRDRRTNIGTARHARAVLANAEPARAFRLRRRSSRGRRAAPARARSRARRRPSLPLPRGRPPERLHARTRRPALTSPTIGGVSSVDARELFAPLGPSYDRVGATLSFGQDPRWRRFLVSRLPPTAATSSTSRPERASSRPSFSAGGSSSPASTRARRCSRALGSDSAHSVELVESSAETLPFAAASFDHLTVTYLLRYVDDPAATLDRARACRPPGRRRGVARVRRARRPGAPGLGALRARRAPARGPRPAEWLARGRRLPRRVDPLVLGGLSTRAAARALVRGRHRRRDRPADEPRRGSRHVGTAAVSAPRPGRPGTRSRRVAGATTSRSCTRRTRRGISRTS